MREEGTLQFHISPRFCEDDLHLDPWNSNFFHKLMLLWYTAFFKINFCYLSKYKKYGNHSFRSESIIHFFSIQGHNSLFR